MSTRIVRRETSSIGDLNQAITLSEWRMRTEGSRAGCKLDIFELGAELECATANILEVLAADDALEGGAVFERNLSNGFEIIGERNALEDVAMLECALADSLEVFVENYALEGDASGKRLLLDDCEQIWESDTREGVAFLECPAS